MKKRIRMLMVITMAMFVFCEYQMARVLLSTGEVRAAVEMTEAEAMPVEATCVVKTNTSEEQKTTEEFKTEFLEKKRFCEANGYVLLEDGSVLYLTLEDIVANIATWYSEEEINEIARMVAGENGNFESETILSAHVWAVLNRLGKKGFAGSESITGVLYSGEFDAVTLHPENMVKLVREDIRAVVVDVLARGIYESMGAPEEKVGRTLPEEFAFFRNEGFRDVHNHFYDDWNEGREYDPFSAPYNPYTT